MSLIGYARVSTEDQVTDAQTDVLKAAGRAAIFREHMSGAKASRPELAEALAKVQRGDVLVVARLDRLARSLSHLLSVIAELDAKGAHFKSLADPIKKLVADVLDRVDQFADFDPRRHYAPTIDEQEMSVAEHASAGAASVDDVELES